MSHVFDSPLASQESVSRQVTREQEPALTMLPAVYTGQVGHYRLSPTEHGFQKRIRMVHVDVDDLAAIDVLPNWSTERGSLMQVRVEDHLEGKSQELGPQIRDLVSRRLGFRPQGRITMLTQPRTWGYVFNPITVYYCWDERDNEIVALAMEVTNTPWKERHIYVVDAREATSSDVDKELHVSPFMPMNQTYRFNWRAPSEVLRFSITIFQDEARVFSADLSLDRQPLTRKTARRTAWTRPWSTLAVTLGIHTQAARLWLKGVRFQKHPDRQEIGSTNTTRGQRQESGDTTPERSGVVKS